VAFSISITKNLIPQVRVAIIDKAEDAVRDAAHYGRDYTRSIAPVRTGALRESFYVNGPNQETDYVFAAGKAKALNPSAHIVPELRAAIVDPKVGQLRDQATGRFTFPQTIVSSAVEYSLYIEEGTVFMAPRPILRQGTLAAEAKFKSDMRKVADGY